MKLRHILLAFFTILIFLVAGCTQANFGLKSTADCDRANAGNPENNIFCYHEAALSQAYLNPGNPEVAKKVCDQIKTIGGSGGSAVNSIAESQADLCYFDIARIARDETICGNIQTNPVASNVFGRSTTKSRCENVTAILKRVNPATYYSGDVRRDDGSIVKRRNICTIIFIIPFTFAMILLARKKMEL